MSQDYLTYGAREFHSVQLALGAGLISLGFAVSKRFGDRANSILKWVGVASIAFLLGYAVFGKVFAANDYLRSNPSDLLPWPAAMTLVRLARDQREPRLWSPASPMVDDAPIRFERSAYDRTTDPDDHRAALTSLLNPTELLGDRPNERRD